VNVATSCSINLGSNEENELEVISTMLAKERAQALLAETRARKERELQDEKNRNKLMLVQVEGQGNMMDDIERGDMPDLEGDSNLSSRDDSGGLQKPRVTVRKMRKGWWR
jgi:hypothetical protein